MGRLSDYFVGVAAKRLRQVEIISDRSNQHEFNAVASLKPILGIVKERKFPTKYIYLSSQDETPIEVEGSTTWYDARYGHETRSEYRLYYQPNAVMEKAAVDDLLVVALDENEHLLVIIAENGSTAEKQLIWLYNISGDAAGKFVLTPQEEIEERQIGFVEQYILESIGVEPVTEVDDNWLDKMPEDYLTEFPKTYDFSKFARETLRDVDCVRYPDEALFHYLNRELLLFRTLEEYYVSDRIKGGFETVDSFIKYSLSIQNRRKARAGASLENHLQWIFQENQIRFKRGARTENDKKPDFIFPGQDEYHSVSFPTESLTMLGAKSSCKDRWRQVLTEADRIEYKHLLTIEPSISENQTGEMQRHNLQLVLPREIHETYTASQQSWLMSLGEFLSLVNDRQNALGNE